jgi:HlyD family secretion protein
MSGELTINPTGRELAEAKPIRAALAPTAAVVLDDSPAGPGRLGIIVGVLFFIVFLGWAAFARLDAAAIGTGQVAVAGNRQAVQHKEGGVIGALKVSEGQEVAAGQILIELRGSDVRAQEQAMAAATIDLEAQQARLLAEISGGGIKWPAAFDEYSPEYQPLIARAKRLQLAQYGARGGALAATRSVAGQRAAESLSQASGFDAQAIAARQQRESLNQQLESTRQLAEEGYASANTVRSLERSLAQTDAAASDYAARAQASRQSAGSMSGEATRSAREYAQSSATALRDTQFNLNETRPKWLALKSQVDALTIRAPVAGKVVGLSVFTVGGVIAPGEKLMEVVPEKAPLIVKANFEPGDVDGVREGEAVEVKFLSIHERDLPILKGVVRNISADALKDQATNQQYFSAEVTVPDSEIAKIREVRGADTGVRLGVPVQVMVGLRERTALQYLLEPLTQTFRTSFKER